MPWLEGVYFNVFEGGIFFSFLWAVNGGIYPTYPPPQRKEFMFTNWQDVYSSWMEMTFHCARHTQLHILPIQSQELAILHPVRLFLIVPPWKEWTRMLAMFKCPHLMMLWIFCCTIGVIMQYSFSSNHCFLFFSPGRSITSVGKLIAYWGQFSTSNMQLSLGCRTLYLFIAFLILGHLSIGIRILSHF